MKRAITIDCADAAVIMGADPRKSAYTLWAEKRGSVPAEPLREPGFLPRIAIAFSKATGKSIIRDLDPRPDSFQVDRCWCMVAGECAGVTCVAGDPGPMGMFQGTLFPKRFYYYCLHHLLVTDRNRWYLVVRVQEDEPVQVYVIPRNREELIALDLAENQFLYRVQTGQPPAVDGSLSTRRTLERLYSKAVEETVDLSPVAVSVEKYLHWREKELECRRAVRTYGNTIREFLGPAACGRLNDLTVIWAPPASDPDGPRQLRIQ